MKGSFERCLSTGSGTVVVEVAIGPDSSVTQANAVKDTFGGTAAACLVQAVKRAKFPAGEARVVRIAAG